MSEPLDTAKAAVSAANGRDQKGETLASRLVIV